MLRKKEIKKTLEEMKEGDLVHFYSHEGRCDRITRTKTGYLSYSSGQGRCDIEAEEFDFETTLKQLWSEKPDFETFEGCGS